MNRKEKQEATRAHLIRACAAMIEYFGLAEITMRAVAVQAGMSTGAIFSNFSCKDELVFAAIRHSRTAARIAEKEVLYRLAEIRQAAGAHLDPPPPSKL